jgi:hypothetical protein
MTILAAAIGATALHLLLLWLFSAATTAWMAVLKGRPEKAGLATGLLLTIAGPIIWLFVPSGAESRWRTEAWLGRVLATIAAAVVLGSLLIIEPYEGIDGAQSFIKPDGATESFDIVAVLAMLFAFVPMAGTARAAALGPRSRPMTNWYMTTAAAVLVTVCLVIKVLSPPDGHDAKLGLILALIAAVVMLVGEVINLVTAARDRETETIHRPAPASAT